MGETSFIRSDSFHGGASTHDCIQVDNENLPKAVRPGDDIAFEDGTLRAVVLETELDHVKIQFKESGTLKQGNSVFIPGHRLAQLPILQGSDKTDIVAVAIKNNFDYISVPNVTSVKDV